MTNRLAYLFLLPSKPEEKKWEEVRQYFDINAHLTGPVGHGIREPKVRKLSHLTLCIRPIPAY